MDEFNILKQVGKLDKHKKLVRAGICRWQQVYTASAAAVYEIDGENSFVNGVVIVAGEIRPKHLTYHKRIKLKGNELFPAFS